MKDFFSGIQPAVKKETKKVAVSTLAGVVIMWAVCIVLHMSFPEKVPVDYTLFLGGICGGGIAVLNFFLMGLTVQSAVAAKDEDTARAKIKSSYSQRRMLQLIWIVTAIVAPCFWFVAGILPLFFPGIGIKIASILKK